MATEPNFNLFDLIDIQSLPLIRCRDCEHCLHSRCRKSYWSNCELKHDARGYKRVKSLELHSCINFKKL
jgi:hypothetical protein